MPPTPSLTADLCDPAAAQAWGRDEIPYMDQFPAVAGQKNPHITIFRMVPLLDAYRQKRLCPQFCFRQLLTVIDLLPAFF